MKLLSWLVLISCTFFYNQAFAYYHHQIDGQQYTITGPESNDNILYYDLPGVQTNTPISGSAAYYLCPMTCMLRTAYPHRDNGADYIKVKLYKYYKQMGTWKYTTDTRDYLVNNLRKVFINFNDESFDPRGTLHIAFVNEGCTAKDTKCRALDPTLQNVVVSCTLDFPGDPYCITPK